MARRVMLHSPPIMFGASGRWPRNVVHEPKRQERWRMPNCHKSSGWHPDQACAADITDVGALLCCQRCTERPLRQLIRQICFIGAPTMRCIDICYKHIAICLRPRLWAFVIVYDIHVGWSKVFSTYARPCSAMHDS